MGSPSSFLSEGKQAGRGQEVAAGYVEVTQRWAVLDDCHEDPAVTGGTCQGEVVQGGEASQELTLGFSRQLLGTGEVKAGQSLATSSDEGAGGGCDQAGTASQGQAPELGHQQEVDGRS